MATEPPVQGPVQMPVRNLNAVLAESNVDRPARLFGSRGSVPAMTKDLLVHPEYDHNL